MSDFLIRVSTPAGLARVELPPHATVDDLCEKIAQSSSIAKDNVKLSFDGRSWAVFPRGAALRDIPQFAEKGVRVTAQPVNAQPEAAPPAAVVETPAPTARGCAHGPNQKCLKCVEPTATSTETIDKPRPRCAHGPGAKCIDCLAPDQAVKHLSFDEYIARNYAKCRNHGPTQRCTNCLIDLKFDYRPKPCANHEPYPRGMCSSCMPPSIAVKRQPYRHVDYAQFSNGAELQQLVQFWLKSQRQRAGLLLGYFAEDPVYEKGVRAVIEAVYEPPQTATAHSVALQEDPFAGHVEKIVQALGFERLGWFFTTHARDVFLAGEEMLAAAQLQERHGVEHPCGLRVSKQLTVVLRADAQGGVAIEVYMVSDQGQRLAADGLLERGESRQFLKVRAAEQTGYAPKFLYQGKNVEQIEPDFFIVNVAHGQPLSTQFNVLRAADFPAVNRAEPQRVENLRDYLRRNRNAGVGKYANFQLLLYLAKVLDLPTALKIAEAVREQREVPPAIEQLVSQRFA